MLVGVPRETKTFENRVGMVPAGVSQLAERGHRVLVEKGAGEGSWIGDEEYRRAGAVVTERQAVFAEAELIVKEGAPA